MNAPLRFLLFVRINPLDSGLADDDLAAALPSRPSGIVLPAAIGAATSREADGSCTAPYQLARSLTLFGAHTAGVPAIDAPHLKATRALLGRAGEA